ncbi:MAG: peptide chain release factor 2 [Candidatus Yanofskybacteria bacterium RIFCSPHIGHO2_01_FULL_44_17]|uniref:Peptide chain release factor 2 n=1 Tax=Candidatus Yanofskybacteria bacterium RIFCSPHIGHO2_01_FULL_44_17 TaxID=1802668 RepID=A0A1F8EW66_9BACT|nr:MAG: peptide chain release factor 2 [Candidatus Yanofskybacteria bacterium RIFCSPHIGHO2_01_FULL_44_17]
MCGEYSKTCRRNSRQSGRGFDLGGARLKISDLEFQMQSPDFWKDHERAGMLSKELNGLKEEVSFWDNFDERLGDYIKIDDEKIASKEAEIKKLKKEFGKQYVGVFLSGRYDRGNALLHVYSGAGGVDAQDWASTLLRMYQKYCEQNGLGFVILHQTFGEQDGTKSAVIEIAGRYAYGYLKGEAGVHRLVRISPFSAKGMRHTSFALVDILPEIEDVKIEIDAKDLRIDTFRSSGPGGQNVNKLETAVRVTHIPTNIAVAVQSERSQAQNKEKAMQLLKSRLAQLMEETQVKELTELRAETQGKEIEWGSQIRSYVLNPYKQVKDHRTGVESSQPEKVLGGELDEFIEAEITK